MSMQFNMLARIESSEFYNNRYFTVVTTPAPDAYSHPSKFKVTSPQPIGQPHQTFELTCQVSGVVREKSFRDKTTGQNKVFNEADVYLEVVNSKLHVPPVSK